MPSELRARLIQNAGADHRRMVRCLCSSTSPTPTSTRALATDVTVYASPTEPKSAGASSSASRIWLMKVQALVLRPFTMSQATPWVAARPSEPALGLASAGLLPAPDIRQLTLPAVRLVACPV